MIPNSRPTPAPHVLSQSTETMTTQPIVSLDRYPRRVSFCSSHSSARGGYVHPLLTSAYQRTSYDYGSSTSNPQNYYPRITPHSLFITSFEEPDSRTPVDSEFLDLYSCHSRSCITEETADKSTHSFDAISLSKEEPNIAASNKRRQPPSGLCRVESKQNMVPFLAVGMRGFLAKRDRSMHTENPTVLQLDYGISVHVNGLSMSLPTRKRDILVEYSESNGCSGDKHYNHWAS